MRENRKANISTAGILQALSGREAPKKSFVMPNIIHFIWAGGENIPSQQYIKSMLLWQEMNPKASIYFWVDKKTTKPEIILEYPNYFLEISEKLNAKKNEIGHFHKSDSSRIQLHDIEEAVSLPGSGASYTIENDYIRYEIDRLKPNYGASSDLLRYRIMYAFGGAYFDFDIHPGNLILDEEVFGKKYDDHKLWVYPFSQNSNNIGNDAFICTPNNPYMALIYELAEANYRTCLSVEDRQDFLKKMQEVASSLKLEFNGASSEFNIMSNSLNLLSDVYCSNDDKYIFYVTPIRTGPGCVRACVDSAISTGANSEYVDELENVADLKHVDLSELAELQSEEVYSEEKDDNQINKLVSKDSGVILLKKSDIIPFNQSGLTWVNQSNITINNVERVIGVAIQSILFEVSQCGYLRLDDHINDIAMSCEISQTQAELMFIRRFDDVVFDRDKIRCVQYNFQHLELSKYYESHGIDYKNNFFPSFGDVGDQYKIPVKSIMSVSSVKRNYDNMTNEIKNKLFHSVVFESLDCIGEMVRGLDFSKRAVEYARLALSEESIEVNARVATYLSFLNDQLEIYVGMVGVLSQFSYKTIEGLGQLEGGLVSTIAEIENLLKPIKPLLDQDDIDFDDEEKSTPRLS